MAFTDFLGGLFSTAAPIIGAINPVAGAASGALGGLLGQQGSNDQARAFNAEEAQKSRDYNTWLLRNQMQLKTADARSAGLNPAFMNGSQLGATPSPMPSPTSPNTFGYDVQSMLLASQKRNLDVDSEKKETESEQNRIKNFWLPQLLKSQVAINDGNVQLIGEKVHLTKTEAENVAQNTENLKAQLEKTNEEIAQIKQSIANMKQDEIYKRIQNYFASSEFKARIASLSASAHLSEAQARSILTLLPLQALNLTAQTNLAEHQAMMQDALGYKSEKEAQLLSVEGDKVNFHLNLDKKYTEIERIVSMGSKCLSACQGALGEIGKALILK